LSSFTWLDFAVLVLVGLFVVRGLLRGTVSQIFGLLGLLLGLWAAGWISRWVGDQWSGARPAVAFWALRWLVAALGGLALASLIAGLGEHLARAVKAGPAAWLDRLGGALVGALVGATVAAFVLMVALQLPVAGSMRGVSRSRLTPGILRGAVVACSLSERAFPGSRWLRERFLEAEYRAAGRVPSV